MCVRVWKLCWDRNTWLMVAATEAAIASAVVGAFGGRNGFCFFHQLGVHSSFVRSTCIYPGLRHFPIAGIQSSICPSPHLRAVHLLLLLLLPLHLHHCPTTRTTRTDNWHVIKCQENMPIHRKKDCLKNVVENTIPHSHKHLHSAYKLRCQWVSCIFSAGAMGSIL